MPSFHVSHIFCFLHIFIFDAIFTLFVSTFYEYWNLFRGIVQEIIFYKEFKEFCHARISLLVCTINVLDLWRTFKMLMDR